MYKHVLAIATVAVVGAADAAPSLAQSSTNPFVLDGLVVTASPTPRARGSIAQHVTILDGRELEARGLVFAVDALREVSGVDVVRGGSLGAVTSVFMRGGESDYTLVLVDGVQVNQAGGGFDFSSLTTRNIERIEIVRGPGSALYGSDAVAGVIHVITRMGSGAGVQGAVRFETASFAERDGLVDGMKLSADMAGGSDRARYTVALGRDVADGIYAFNSGHENLSLSGAARFLPDDRTRIALTLRLEDREYRYPTNGAGALVDRNAFFFEDETIANVSFARAVTEALEVEALIGLTETDGGTDDAFDDPSDTGSFKSLDHFRRTTAQLRSHLRLGASVLTVGGEVEEERQRSFSESQSSFGPFYGRAENGRLNLAAFGHATGERGPLALSLGGRVEDNERYGVIATWQAGVAANWPGRPGTRLRVSAGSAIKEPTFVENYATGFALGNPELDPEWSLSWEAGVEHEVAPGVTAAVTYFDQRFEEMIQYTFAPPNPTDPNYFNVAAATARGLEVDARVVAGRVDASANWTWLDTEVVDAGLEGAPGDLFVDGQPLIRRPRHSVNLAASSALTERVRLHSELLVVGAREDRDFSTFPATPVGMPRHMLLSLGAEWVARQQAPGLASMSLTLRAENLFDASYAETFGFPAPGRRLYAGVAVGFGGP
ncbi:MAG: TonB-dependent receptor [Longimicrobiales bacterium]